MNYDDLLRRTRMQAKDMYGNELHVGDLIAAADNEQERKFVLFITEIDTATVKGYSMHVSSNYLCSFDGTSRVNPADYIKLQPVPGLVQPLIVDESTEPTLK